MRRKLLFAVLTLVLVLGAVELLTFLFFLDQRDNYTFYDPARYTVDQPHLEKLRSYYDRELGWKKPVPTPFGERPREREYGSPLLATFGDSYTYCDDVEDDETWQTYLSRTVRRDVFNFGGNGYGTDQAYLRYLEDYPKVGTPVVAMGLTTDNIKRIVNVYRKFFYRRTGIPATKPRFVLAGGELKLIENPIASVDELERLQDVEFLQRIGRYDLWFNKNDYPQFGFPRTRILFHRSFWLEVRHGKLGNDINDIDPRPWVDLWEHADSRQLMFAIFDAFFEDARRRGTRPILMLLPKEREVAQRSRQGNDTPSVRHVIDYAARRGYLLFDGVGELAGEVRSGRRLDSLYSNHLTPAGNRILARRLHAWLESHGLLGEPD